MNASGFFGLVLLLVSCGLAGNAAAQHARVPPGGACSSEADCNDALYCNGMETCAAGVCQRGTPPCNPVERAVCIEGETRCKVFRDDRDYDGHYSQATGGDDCDDQDVHTFPGNPEVWDPADHDEDCNPDSHGYPAAFGEVGAPGRGQACSGETMVVLMRGSPTPGVETPPDSFTEVSCGPGMACGGPGVCIAKGAEYVAPPLLGALPQRPQAWHAALPPSPLPSTAAPAEPAPGADLRRALAAPAAIRPVMPPMPTATPAPVSKAPVAVPVAGPKVACPKGEAYNAAVKKCIPIPPL